MYVRVTRTVQDRGVLVRPVDVNSTVTDREVDWYSSAFTFGEDAKEYWEANGDSIKGYSGEVFTSVPYWDLDCKQDFSKAKKAAIDLTNKLVEMGFTSGLEIYFSGNKGFHVMLHTKQRFTPTETGAFCYNLAMQAGVPPEVFDTTVYNITRIFRVANTRHQESGLFKIPLDLDELNSMKEKDIRELAAEPRFEEFDVAEVDVSEIKEKYKVASKPRMEVKLPSTNLSGNTVIEFDDSIDFSMCPPGQRRCVYALEQGHYGPSERHAAILRLAAFYRGNGFSRTHAGNLIYESLKNRALVHPEASEPNAQECDRDIDQVYSDDWKGGTFSCKTDVYLQSKCDQGKGPCYDDAKVQIRNVMTISQMLQNYVKYGEEALAEYPKFGLSWLDERIRLRPKNYSVVAGANGSGKTSLVIQLMENLNKQKMFHVFFSIDMSDTSLTEKLAARFTSYTQAQIEKAFNAHTPDHELQAEIKEAVESALPYTLFNCESTVTLQYIEQTLTGLKQVYNNLQLAIVDYAGRILGSFDNQYANATHNANMANDVAKRTSTHLLFLSQVPREKGDHTDALRSSRVSKDSGAWEENATAVITMWRPFGAGLVGRDAYVHLYIAKNRSGAQAENVFHWEGKTGTISEMRTQKEFEQYRIMCEQNEVEPPKFNWFVEENVEDNSRFSSEASGERFVYADEEKKVEEKQDVREEVQDNPSKRFRFPKQGSGRA